MQPDNIYLIGMMGAGKSAVGKSLASLLQRKFVDLDSVIEKEAGLSIEQIFAEKGEDFFRGLENSALTRCAESKGLVVATGGGIVSRPENVERMRSTGGIVYLQAAAHVLVERVSGTTHRPLLKVENWQGRLREILESRRPLYESAADLTVLTDGKTAAQSAMLAKELLEKKYA